MPDLLLRQVLRKGGIIIQFQCPQCANWNDLEARRDTISVEQSPGRRDYAVRCRCGFTEVVHVRAGGQS